MCIPLDFAASEKYENYKLKVNQCYTAYSHKVMYTLYGVFPREFKPEGDRSGEIILSNMG